MSLSLFSWPFSVDDFVLMVCIRVFGLVFLLCSLFFCFCDVYDFAVAFLLLRVVVPMF